MVKHLLLIIMFFAATQLGAQQNDVYTSYGTNEGLPQSSVWSIAQDSKGLMWFTTSDGLCRYDGYNFTTYRGTEQGSNVIVSGAYVRIYIDSSDNLWTVSQRGIGYYDKMSDKFAVAFRNNEDDTYNHNAIVGEDSQFILAGVSALGLVKINKQTRKITKITGGQLPAVVLWRMTAATNNEVWIAGAQRGSFVYNIATRSIDTIPSLTLTNIINYNDSELLSVTSQYLVLFKKKDHSYKTIPLDINKEDINITGVRQLSPHELVATGSKGLYYIDNRTWKVTRHVRSFTSGPNSYAYLQSSYKDRSGNLWLGTNGDGLKKLTAPFKCFKHYSSFKTNGNLVKAIYADSTEIHVGYYDNGIDIFDRVSGLKRSYKPGSGQPSFPSSVLAVTGLPGYGPIFRAEPPNAIAMVQNGRVVNLSAYFFKALKVEKIYSANPFLYRAGTTLYMNVADGLLVSFQLCNGKPCNITQVHNFGNEMLNCMYIEDDGTIWVGTSNGVFRLKNGKVIRAAISESVFMKSISQDSYGHIWVGCLAGIYVLDTNGKVLQHYTDNNGLPNQFIYGILQDKNGDMWCSHNKGLSVFRKASKTFRNYDYSDGLQSNEFNTGAYFRGADGELFFGGVNGVNSFYPEEIKDNPNKPEVIITSIKLFDVPLKTDTAYWNIHTLTLPYEQNTLSFEFAALEYTNTDKNQYAYMMEGVDEQWINSGRRFTRYAALPPGTYTFKVKASNNDGVWQDKPTTIVIHIIPPIWQRFWFRLLVGLCAIAGLAAITIWVQKLRHRRQIRALELQQKIQLERERISRDLHDAVGTQLSLISNNIEWVTHPLKEISEQEKKEKLQFVNDTARDIIATLRETIWALNKELITYEGFSDKLKGFIQKQLALYPQLRLNYVEQLGEGIVLGPSEALNLFRICQEVISNSLKYAQAGVMDIALSNEHGKYKVTIADDGIGFDISQVRADVQNGLENIRYRAEDIGAHLEIYSSAGSGTRVTITKK